MMFAKPFAGITASTILPRRCLQDLGVLWKVFQNQNQKVWFIFSSLIHPKGGEQDSSPTKLPHPGLHAFCTGAQLGWERRGGEVVQNV